jgi:hypothetical protein
MSKKFTFDDLQPPSEMLIEALQNVGACASGFPYATGVKEVAEDYRQLLLKVRGEQRFLFLQEELDLLASTVLRNAGSNQTDRLKKIVEGLDIYIKREYNKA